MSFDLPKGFSAGAAEASFKKPGRLDLGIIYSELPCAACGLFTQNLFAAAPVLIDREILKKGGPCRAIIGNSGQANACSGQEGLENCHEIQLMGAKLLNIKPEEILLISTGVIGARFNMEKWREALPKAAADLGNQDAEGFTSAIMTTDSFPKFASEKIRLRDGETILTVMAKGAGMICPNMATMLCVCATDVKVEKDCWQEMFSRAAERTFNRVSVDGDTSTNDSILGLANGASGVSISTAEDHEKFEAALFSILSRVAYMLVQDGEGALKVMRISVKGAKTDKDAELAARAVGNSQLVKTAIYGGDANWGRIINAVGYSGANVNPAETSLRLCGIERFKNGQPVNDQAEAELAKLLKEPEIAIDISLGNGDGSYDLLASDLGHEYVSLNSDYRS